MDTQLQSDYSKILQEAEKQVAGIQNEKLREIAFGKLVDHLLSEGPTNNTRSRNSDEPREPKTKRKSKASTPNKGKTDGPKAWIAELAEEGFFDKPKSSSDIRGELESRSHHLSATDITKPLQTLCHEKILRRKKFAPENGAKAVLHWVKW